MLSDELAMILVVFHQECWPLCMILLAAGDIQVGDEMVLLAVVIANHCVQRAAPSVIASKNECLSLCSVMAIHI